jgi:hypothetical protein
MNNNIPVETDGKSVSLKEQEYTMTISNSVPLQGYTFSHKLQPILEVLKRIIASGYVKFEDENGKIVRHPLSCLLISNIGGGKTTLLKKTTEISEKGIIFTTDITPYGFWRIWSEHKEDFRNGKITHIVIPDLTTPFSRNKTIVNHFVGFMNALIEEGIAHIKTFYITIEEPIQIGLITATTTSDFNLRKRGWLGIGFIQRMLPISFSYAKQDVFQILEDIAQHKIKGLETEKLRQHIKLINGNSEIETRLIPYALEIDSIYDKTTFKTKSKKTYTIEKPEPFRRQKQLSLLLMANALLRGDNQIREQDFQWFKTVARWINFDFNPL